MHPQVQEAFTSRFPSFSSPQVSIFFPRACASLGISTEFADKEATAMRAALAPVMSFWVGVRGGRRWVNCSS